MNKKRNWGKEIKDVGMLFIIIGVIFLAMILFTFISSNTSSVLYQIVDKHFVFIIIGGLVSLLFGIIVRSIGRSKEKKFNDNK